MKMSKKSKRIASAIVILIGIALLVLLDTKTIGNDYTRRILNMGAIYAIVAVSMNLVNGFTGLFSLGQAGFMSIGAYVVAIFTVPV